VIFVLVGTSPYPFTRLIRAVDELAGRLGWQVFMQTGSSPYRPVHAEHAAFLPHEEVLRRARDCELLIAQGGAGSIREGLAAGKPVVAVPRQLALGETQAGQDALVRALDALGCLIGVDDVADLEGAVARARGLRAAPLPANRIPALVREFLVSIGIR
jgi:UDP-N-acetylglucosamine transferase subunit ALG13